MLADSFRVRLRTRVADVRTVGGSAAARDANTLNRGVRCESPLLLHWPPPHGIFGRSARVRVSLVVPGLWATSAALKMMAWIAFFKNRTS